MFLLPMELISFDPISTSVEHEQGDFRSESGPHQVITGSEGEGFGGIWRGLGPSPLPIPLQTREHKTPSDRFLPRFVAVCDLKGPRSLHAVFKGAFFPAW